MIDSTTIDILCQGETIHSIDELIESDAAAIALDKRVANARLVATQVKYLQRAKGKLPSYYAARCIIPSRAYEQSSSEATAKSRDLSGESLLELTCGLGVDTLYLSRRFKRVVTLEPDASLARVTRINFQRLGVDNVEVVNATAEEYLQGCAERFDVIYVDPDRRVESGDKVVRIEDCSPNIVDLMPRIMEVAPSVSIKLSPLFDVDQAFKLFSPAKVEVLSLGRECKEVVVTTPHLCDELVCRALGVGEVSLRVEDIDNSPSSGEFNPDGWSYLIIPDVAIQKSRVACQVLKGCASIWSNNGYAFTRQEPQAGVMGRVEQIDFIDEYNPKRLKKWLKEHNIRGVEILKRDFPLGVEQIAKQLGVKSGGEQRIAFTKIFGKLYSIVLR